MPNEAGVPDTKWHPLPDRPLACDQSNVHVLRVSLSETRWAGNDAWADLTPEEIARAERYVVEPPRRRFLLCRRALRRCIGWLTASAAANVAFGVERNGKPTLNFPPHSELMFNVSHTDDWGVVAFAWGRNIGIDIEAARSNLDTSALASRFFSEQERNDLFALPVDRQHSAFYRLWTTKEAYMKAVGLGMAVPLGSFSAAADPLTEPRLLGGDVQEGPWTAAGFQVMPSVPGVVMWDHGPATVCYWDAPDQW